MNTSTRHFTPEELMAFSEGELATDMSAAVTEHMKTCADCRQTELQIEESRRVLLAWTVENLPSAAVDRISSRVASELAGQRTSTVKGSGTKDWKRLVLNTAGAACVILVLVALSVPNLLRSRMAANEASAVGSLRTINTAAVSYSERYGEYPPSLTNMGPSATGEISAAAADLIDSVLASGLKSGYRFRYARFAGFGSRGGYQVNADPVKPGDSGVRHFSTDQTGVIRWDGKVLDGMFSDDRRSSQTVTNITPTEPMVARASELKVVVSNLDGARRVLDEILKRHGGYVGQLSANSEDGSIPSTAASLRVPTEELDACVSEIRALGRVTQESETGEELSQPHIDLVARLKNARNTEVRINDLVQKRAGNVKEVLAVETEGARVRGDIERMDAELKTIEKRVSYAVISLTLSEEYKAKLQADATNTRTRLRNALVAGLRDAWQSLLDMLVWCLSMIPTLALWSLIAGLPLRWIWRRWRLANTISTTIGA